LQLPPNSNWSQLESVRFTFVRNPPHLPQIASLLYLESYFSDGGIMTCVDRSERNIFFSKPSTSLSDMQP
jgi:hypothetical protein